MTGKITAIINTLNEERNIARALASVKWADEVIVCDMHSEDQTAVIAKRLGATVIFHKPMGYVEPARNFAISKASHEWVLIVDADEEIPATLAERLQELAKEENSVITHVEIPRKNIIFGSWIKGSMWWPDFNIRFFRKNAVTWTNAIHHKPKVEGQGLSLLADEKLAIVHYHYDTVSQFITRMNRYTDIQAKELIKDEYHFKWQDLLQKPLSEFLSRYFANQGYKDGLHGLTLALLQAFSFVVVYAKTWETQGFQPQTISLKELDAQSVKSGKEIDYWLKFVALSPNPIKRVAQKIKNKLSS